MNGQQPKRRPDSLHLACAHMAAAMTGGKLLISSLCKAFITTNDKGVCVRVCVRVCVCGHEGGAQGDTML